jgi:hypothetical protein
MENAYFHVRSSINDGMILMCMTSSQGSNTGAHHVGFFKIFEINPGIKLL